MEDDGGKWGADWVDLSLNISLAMKVSQVITSDLCDGGLSF